VEGGGGGGKKTLGGVTSRLSPEREVRIGSMRGGKEMRPVGTVGEKNLDEKTDQWGGVHNKKKGRKLGVIQKPTQQPTKWGVAQLKAETAGGIWV